MWSKRKQNWESSKGIKLNTKLTAIILVFVMVPIAILSGVMFYNMEESTVNENLTYMESTMARRQDSIQNNIDSINMTTQFFLSDSTMNSVLLNAKNGGTYSTKQWINIYKTDVAALERLINTNPVLAGVRYYAYNDNVQEMMPVMYTNSRMQKQEWVSLAETGGWTFDYVDHLFSNSETSPLLGLITPIKNKKDGTIGVIEANMKM
ncbi:MAG: two-component sensor histidine kinase, partial [Pseudobutyrivibrio sp.]|nr:two-component sensor histidine kinase [Pseudobutyrivibrio sp.]